MRAVWAAAGLGWFFWLGFEDASSGFAILLAGVLCLTSGITIVARSRTPGSAHSHRSGALRTVLTTTLLGAAVGPITAVLMMVKTGLHGHIPPDFNIQDVLGMLQRTPVWGMAGVLVGLAWILAEKAIGPDGAR